MKTFYLTLDFEEDLGSATRDNTYFSHQGSEDFISTVRENDWKVTLFVTGEILAERPGLLAPYEAQAGHFSFGLHSYNHEAVFGSPAERLRNLQRGLEAYLAHFGHAPRLYRAPQRHDLPARAGTAGRSRSACRLQLLSGLFPRPLQPPACAPGALPPR